MNDDTDDDLPAALTKVLRNVDGVHTVYATKPLVPTIVTAVVEAVRNDPVGLHLVTVDYDDGLYEVITCIGTTADEPAPEVGRRAHDALRQHFLDMKLPAPRSITVRIGRIG